MDKLKEKWSKLSKKLKEESADAQRGLRRAFQGEPQAFAGQARKLNADPEPKCATGAPGPQQTSAAPQRPPSAAANAAAAAALARLEAKNKPAGGPVARRPAAAPRPTPAAAAPLPQPPAPAPPSRGPGVDAQRVLDRIADPDIQDAVALMVTDPAWTATGPVVLKLLGNVAANPDEPKFRRLRMSNAKIHAAVVDTAGALELLRSVGFDLSFKAPVPAGPPALAAGAAAAEADVPSSSTGITTEPVPLQQQEEEGFLVLAQATDLTALRSAVQALSQLLPGVPVPQPSPASLRCTKVLLPTAVDAEVPDWFYEVTGPEVKSMYLAAVKKRQESEVLLTQALREQMAAAKAALRPVPPSYASARIRVRLPEGLLLQGTFQANEPLGAVFDWLAGALDRPDVKYELVLPDRRLLGAGLDASATVGSADLAPSTLLNFRWADSEEAKAQVAKRPTLKHELVQAATADDEHLHS